MPFTHLAAVLAEVEPLGRLFAAEGYRLFLVGGIVRDQWLDEPLDASSDIDLTTDARPADIKRIVGDYAEDMWTQGERFGTIGLRASGRDYEITTHRAESYTSDSRKPQVNFGDDVAVDLSRRDFTVNAMAIELPDGELVDPFGGAHDLQQSRLTTPQSADLSFTDDPLRMLRAARFSARLGLVPDAEVAESALRLHERLRIVAIERIGVEMRRLLALPQPLVGLQFLADTGLLREVLSYGEPALGAAVQPLLASALATADELTADWRLRLAGIGLAVFDDADSVYAMCRRLRLSRDDERYVTRLSRAAMEVLVTDPDAASLRRWVTICDNHDGALELASVLADDPEHVDRFRTELHELRASGGLGEMTLLDGATIMDTLGVSPGPVIGRAHAFLQEQYFAHGPQSEAEQLELLAAWWAQQDDAESAD